MAEIVRDHFTAAMIGQVVEITVYKGDAFTCVGCGVLEMWSENASTGITAAKIVGGEQNVIRWRTEENVFNVTYDPERVR